MVRERSRVRIPFQAQYFKRQATNIKIQTNYNLQSRTGLVWMAVQIQTYLRDEVTSELLEKYFEVKWADGVVKADEKEKRVHQDQFEPSRVDLVGLVLASDGDRLVGGLKLFARTCKLESMSYRLGGIGGVFTLREYQRQGVASLMLAKAMLALDELKADVAYLCTVVKRLEKLYWPFGFRHLKQGHTFLGKSGKRYTEYDGMLAMVNSSDVFQKLMTSQKPLDIGVGNW